MFDYLQQFNSLPKDLRDKVSSAGAMAALAELEKRYQVDLAMAVMKVMIKSITIKNLPAYFISDFNLSQTLAENLSKELTDKIFLNVADYLGLQKEAKALDLETDINLIIEEAGLFLPSSDSVNRFKSVLSTYLKGVRSKIAARDALTKPVNMGGLNLSPLEVDRVFKVCEQKTFKSIEVNLETIRKTPSPLSRLDKIIASADGGAAGSEYNLKQAIASGQVKKLETVPVKPQAQEVAPVKQKLETAPVKKIIRPNLDTSHELGVPEKQLDLPLVAASTVLSATKLPTPTVNQEKPVKETLKPAPVSQVVKPIKPIQKIQKPVKKTGFFGRFMKATPEVVRVAPVAPKPIPVSRPIFAPSISKPAMHDIKPVPKVMGPLEELQFIDLLNFRRLGKTPTEITAKIFSKVKLLEADGYDKMVAGVRAWRQSPVNRLYLKMVQEAIGQGITIKDLALAKQKESKDYLSLEEIEAILAMNSKLAF